MADIASLTILALLLGVIGAIIFRERRRTRKVMSLLHAETQGLAREAAELAQALCQRQADGVAIDQTVLDRYALGEPQTYAGLVPSLWRLPADFAWRAVEFHGTLALARARLPGWRDGARDRVSTYLLISALSRAANTGHGLVLYMERRMGWRSMWKPHMPAVTPLMDEMEKEDWPLLDQGYWSMPA